MPLVVIADLIRNPWIPDRVRDDNGEGQDDNGEVRGVKGEAQCDNCGVW